MQREINLNNLNNIMLQLVIVCFITCMYLFARAGIHATACILRSKDKLWKSALSDHRGSREWTEVMRLGGKHLDSLNHSYGLICFILSFKIYGNLVQYWALSSRGWLVQRDYIQKSYWVSQGLVSRAEMESFLVPPKTKAVCHSWA